LFWIGSFFDLCRVTADTSKLPKPKIKNPRGSHYEVHFEVALLFGLTELKAQLVWKEDGIEKRWVRLPPAQLRLLRTSRSPAKIVYDQVEGIAKV